MKLRDILEPEEQRLDEITLKQAVAAGMIGAAAMSPRSVSVAHADPEQKRQTFAQHLKQPQQQAPQPPVAQAPQVNPQQDALVAQVVDKYNIDDELAAEVVELAHKYEHEDFPTAKDILAIVGVESSFRPDAVSRLKRDPARGLMQVRAGVWKIDPEELEDIEQNIKHGSQILRRYYEKLGNIRSAIQAYNIGITKYRKGEKNPRYLDKYQQEYRDLLAASDA